MRRATRSNVRQAFRRSISIHALHEESDTGAIESIAIQGISIHALHEESDRTVDQLAPVQGYFNPRSP